jgi:hypothetical protein
LVRYLPDTYQRMQVQLYRPEGLTVSEDAQGRIKAIEDAVGNRIEVEYDGTIPALTYTGDEAVKGYALSAIRFVGPPDFEDPRELPVSAHLGVGWVLCGMPGLGGAGVPAAGGSARYTEAAARYQWAVAHRAELQRLEAEFTRFHPQRRPGDALAINRLMRLASFCEALRLAMAEAVPDEFHPEFPLLNDRLTLGYRAWASVLGGVAIGTPSVPVASRYAKRIIPDIKWKSPEAKLIYETLTSAAKANGTLQKGGLSNAKSQAAAADARAAWDDYLKLTGRTANAIGVAHTVSGVSSPWSVPLKLFRPILDGVVNLWIMAGTALAAADPPRDDYTTLAPVPVLVLDMGPIAGGAGISAQRLVAAQKLVPAMLTLAAELHACVVTYDRVGGALRAGDPVWAARQAGALAGLEREAGLAMLEAADALEAWLLVLRDEGEEDVLVTIPQLKAWQEQLRTGGYDSELIAAFWQLGLNDTEIENCRQAALSVPLPEEDLWIINTMESLPATWREVGRRLMQITVVRSP